MRSFTTALALVSLLFLACSGSMGRRTLSSLQRVKPDLNDVRVDVGFEQALNGYRKFLEDAPESSLTPEAMRRLADLQLEKQYGYIGGAGGQSMPAPAKSNASIDEPPGRRTASGPGSLAASEPSESDRAFEERASAELEIASSGTALQLPGDGDASTADQTKGPLEAIALYDKILASYPDYPHNDEVLYQKARAYDELGRTDEAIEVIEQLIASYPDSRALDEAQFRRAEYFFTRRRYLEAESAYQSVTRMGPGTRYYELALYKLGWTFYKQEMHQEALDTYVALLDHKVETGYDFEGSHEETDERRIADTFRVVSLSFSNIGGAETVQSYFQASGTRSYEDKIYSHLGEFYLEKLRYADAAGAYETFVDLHPFHRSSPRFSMRVVEIYEEGGFGKLVLESKKRFASRYAVDSEYWVRFPIEESPEVVEYLKSNLNDLASHYHAMYQQGTKREEKVESYHEALHWYRVYLASFGGAPETPELNYRLADLHLEEKDFVSAALEYERTAYEYSAHARAASAGYAAIYAHRQNEKNASDETKPAATLMAVKSTLRFVDAFPNHEHAAVVMGAAVDDLYNMKDLEQVLVTGKRLIESYPDADPTVLRQAWITVAHAHFDVGQYSQAESAYAQSLEMTTAEDPSRAGLVDNLAAAIYKQGEQAREAEDYRTAADHFLRVATAAPTSTIRPAAEFDAGAALVRLQDWASAASVLESFRDGYPEHELNKEATRQIASIYRSAGNPARAAEEYERVAVEADGADFKRDALLVAGELYEEAELIAKALAVYQGYVRAFPAPLETAIETRFKIAGLHGRLDDEPSRNRALRQIVALDAQAGDERTDRVRYLAARSALQLTEMQYDDFRSISIVQPFQTNLRKKQQSMNEAIAAFGKLVDYEVGEVTAAATFYIAEVYFEFSRSLLESERPGDLSEAELEDYEFVLEEEAYPFEERSIKVHEKNLELISVGVYNAWVDKSIGRLGVMMPGRYAKFEESVGVIGSLERYAYLPPSLPEAVPAEDGAVETEVAAPATPGQEVAQGSEASAEPAPDAPESTPGEGAAVETEIAAPASPAPDAEPGPEASPEPAPDAPESTPGEGAAVETEIAAPASPAPDAEPGPEASPEPAPDAPESTPGEVEPPETEIAEPVETEVAPAPAASPDSSEVESSNDEAVG